MAGNAIIPGKYNLNLREEKVINIADGTADGDAVNRKQLNEKVDKVSGKGLSTNDFTNDDHSKLDNIEAGAQVNVGVEYTQTEKTKLDGIETGAQVNVGVEYTQAEKTKLGTYPNDYDTIDNIIAATNYSSPGSRVNIPLGNTNTGVATTLTTVDYVEDGLTRKVDDGQIKQAYPSNTAEDATDVLSIAGLKTEFAKKQDNITGDTESITIPGAGAGGTDLVFEGGSDFQIPGYAVSTDYVAGNFVHSNGEIFVCILDYTSPNSQATPQNQPVHWDSITTQVTEIDTLDALTKLNSLNEPQATIDPGELFIVYGDTDENNGLYIIVTTDRINFTDLTTVTKLVGFGGGGFTNGQQVRLGTGSTLGADGSAVAIATTDDITPEQTLPTIGFASMLVDAGAGSGNTPNWVGFKPLMTGLATDGTDANLNFAVEEASEFYKDHVTTREWQEARFSAPILAVGRYVQDNVTYGPDAAGLPRLTFNVNADLVAFLNELGYPVTTDQVHTDDRAGITLVFVEDDGTETIVGIGEGRWEYDASETHIVFGTTAVPITTVPTETLTNVEVYFTGDLEAVTRFAAGENTVLRVNNGAVFIDSEAGGTTGSSVKVNDNDVTNPNFKANQSTNPAEEHLYSPAFETEGDVVSVQIDDREILPVVQEEVRQIIEELSNPGGYTWVEEDIFQTVFLTNRTNSSGTTDQTTILQPHFVDTTNIFTTYAVLSGTADTGLRNDWNGASSQTVVVGLGPDVPDLIAFQLISTYYRDSTAQGLAEIKLKMIDPDGDFPGPSDAGTNTNKEQFISWISNNDNPNTPADPNPVVHSGVSTYYYETDNDFLDTVRHSVGSHITGSSLTADERTLVDGLLAITDNSVDGTFIGVNGSAISTVNPQQTFFTTSDNDPLVLFGVGGALVSRINEVSAGDLLIVSTSGAGGYTNVYVRNTTGTTDSNAGWTGPTSLTTQEGLGALANVTFSDQGQNVEIKAPANHGLIIEGNPSPGELNDDARSVVIEQVVFNEQAVTNVTTLAGDTNNGGIVATGVATVNGAPINALEKVGYFLGTKGVASTTTVTGVAGNVDYTPFTTSQGGVDYIRYFHKGIALGTNPGTFVAGKGVWANEIITTTPSATLSAINLIG